MLQAMPMLHMHNIETNGMTLKQMAQNNANVTPMTLKQMAWGEIHSKKWRDCIKLSAYFGISEF